jgi:hypothetical protein
MAGWEASFVCGAGAGGVADWARARGVVIAQAITQANKRTVSFFMMAPEPKCLKNHLKNLKALF